MSSITEERQKILKKKLKEMGNYGVQVRTPEESPFYDQPTDYERELERMQVDDPEEEESHVQPLKESSVEEKAAEERPARKSRAKGNKEEGMPVGLSFEEYQERYFVRLSDRNGKSGFTINSEILQLLKDVLRDVRAKTTITSYIENILLEHLKEHQALLNKTATQYKRNQTLNL